MTTDVATGDTEVPFLAVAPADVTTTVTCAVNRPDGTSTPLTMTGGALTPIPDTSPAQNSQTWTAVTAVVYDIPGHWVLHYTVTGTGEGAEDYEVFVVPSPTAGGPTWTPGRSRVANYVPHRTLARSVSSIIDSQDAYVMTFDGTTNPTGLQTDALIVDAVAWVRARVTPMHPTMTDLARAVAALLTAAWIERSWPNDDQSLQRANDMEKRVDLLMADLITANRTSNDGDLVTPPGAPAVSPYWSFPPADTRYDSPLYW